jgi:hypothetical protein
MMHRKFGIAAIAAMALLAAGSSASAATITGWSVHNGTAPTTGGSAEAPTFTPADNITLMAPFDPITLANDGDSITASTVLTMNNRSSTGVNSLNTQLRFGLFNGPAGAVAAEDVPNLGFIIEYSNVAAGGLIREQQSAAQTSPFTSPADLGNGSQDAGADSIQGANPGPVTLELTLTRVGGLINLSGSISGTDSVSSNPYLATYTANGLSSANFPADGAFTFNRVGLFLGNNVNAESGGLTDSSVTTNVPEPAAGVLAVLGALVALASRPRAWKELARNGR